MTATPNPWISAARGESRYRRAERDRFDVLAAAYDTQEVSGTTPPSGKVCRPSECSIEVEHYDRKRCDQLLGTVLLTHRADPDVWRPDRQAFAVKTRGMSRVSLRLGRLLQPCPQIGKVVGPIEDDIGHRPSGGDPLG